MSKFVVVVPARYASTRLPGKPLRLLNGRTMLEHVWLRATASGADEVVIATDDDRIAETAETFGATACMTSEHHRSGTERIAEVADVFDWGDGTVIVNLQGDEPAMPPTLLDQCAALLDDPAADMATLASPIASADDFENPNVVKVVLDAAGNALYFSRAGIPYPRDVSGGKHARDLALHHHGIYAYRCGVLRQLVRAEPTDLERVEALEQLRALALGFSIRVGRPIERPGRGVDSEDDIAPVESELLEIYGP